MVLAPGGEKHGVYLSDPASCADATVNTYLATGRLPAAGRHLPGPGALPVTSPGRGGGGPPPPPPPPRARPARGRGARGGAGGGAAGG
ncbi:alpha/beta hydrolase, partial [Streptomyces yangpuensis]|uniref:alpha/beta hydrolase n=1 Tax=Streptomyces yangpuensis TaxID=1648182 RepID=UPI0036B1C826